MVVFHDGIGWLLLRGPLMDDSASWSFLSGTRNWDLCDPRTFVVRSLHQRGLGSARWLQRRLDMKTMLRPSVALSPIDMGGRTCGED